MKSDSSSCGSRYGKAHAVVVTYGDRVRLLTRTLDALAVEPDVVAVTVVDNGSSADVASAVAPYRSKLAVFIESLPQNEGSASGFGKGLKAAATSGLGEFLLVLDDDNCIRNGGVRRLLQLHQILSSDDRAVAICCLRAGRSVYEELLKCRSTPQIEENSCLGFHIRQVPSRVHRRIMRRHSPPATDGRRARVVEMQYAPYGGLFLPVSILSGVSGPDASYVLYSDDNEFTARMVRSGVTIYLTDAVVVDDIDASWSEAQGQRSVWVGAYALPWRVYYSARNRMRFEQMFVTSPSIYAINRAVLFAVFLFQAILERRSIAGVRNAFSPLAAAWRDYSLRRFGVSESYPLPSAAPLQTLRKVEL